jgi:hypothetical protein
VNVHDSVGGTLPLDTQRGPLSGRIAGAFENTFFNFLAVNVNWKL